MRLGEDVMNAINRFRHLAGASLVLIIVCVALISAFASQGVAATPSVEIKSSAYGFLEKFMSEYNATGFSKVVKIGNLTTYRTTLNEGVSVKIDPSLSAIAKYDPQTKTITFSKDPRTVDSADSLAFGETVWHELTHAIEDAHGDIGALNSEAYAERNVDYMTNVINVALPNLSRMESHAKGGSKAASLDAYWDKFIKNMGSASKLTSKKGYPPDLETMREWFGFQVDPEQIRAMYLTNKAFSSKKWAQLRAALKKEPHTWTGEWDSNFGAMSLSQSGTAVTGYYEWQGGKFTGTVNGKTLTGRWSEAPTYSAPDDAGPAILTISADGKSFSGDWGYDGHGGGHWSGTRLR
jgi:hypothetical protein